MCEVGLWGGLDRYRWFDVIWSRLAQLRRPGGCGCVTVTVSLGSKGGHGTLEGRLIRCVCVKDVYHDTFINNNILVVWITLLHLDHFGKYPAHTSQVANTFCTFQ